jgi:hypothetical protein
MFQNSTILIFSSEEREPMNPDAVEFKPSFLTIPKQTNEIGNLLKDLCFRNHRHL